MTQFFKDSLNAVFLFMFYQLYLSFTIFQFIKKWANPGVFLFIFVLITFQFK